MLTSSFPFVRVVSTDDGGTRFVDDAVALADPGDVGRRSVFVTLPDDVLERRA